MRRLGRAWGTSIVAWLAVVALGAAIAVASESDDVPVDDVVVEDTVTEDVVTEDVVVTEVVEETETEVTVEAGDKEQNHGRCVSYWAKEAKTQGLEGKRKGAFVSSVAENPDAIGDGGTETCDFQADLDTALADQAAAELEESEEAAEATGDEESGEEEGSEATSDPTSSDAGGEEETVDDGKGGGNDKARRWKAGV